MVMRSLYFSSGRRPLRQSVRPQLDIDQLVCLPRVPQGGRANMIRVEAVAVDEEDKALRPGSGRLRLPQMRAGTHDRATRREGGALEQLSTIHVHGIVLPSILGWLRCGRETHPK